MSDVVRYSSSFTAHSGQGFLGGNQVQAVTSVPDTTRKWTLTGNNAANTSAWLAPVPTSSGYTNNMQLFLTGTYPQLPPYAPTNELVEPGSGDRVCSFSQTSLVGCVAPNLPSVGTAVAVYRHRIFPAVGLTADVAGINSYLGGVLKSRFVSIEGRIRTVENIRLRRCGIVAAVSGTHSRYRLRLQLLGQSGRGRNKSELDHAKRAWRLQLFIWKPDPAYNDLENYSKTCVLDANKPQLYMSASGTSKEPTFWVDDIKVRAR